MCAIALLVVFTHTPGHPADAKLGDGGPAVQAKLKNPCGVVVDADGNVYIADSGNNRIRKVDGKTGLITTIAGGGASHADGIPAGDAALRTPQSMILDRAGQLVFTDGASRVRRIDTQTGMLTTLIGGGNVKVRPGKQVPARDVQFGQLTRIAMNAAGDVFVVDRHGYILMYEQKTGLVTVVAGTGPRGYAGDGGPASEATLNEPFGLAVAPQGHLYFTDQHNLVVRKVDAATGRISTVAGTREATGKNGLDRVQQGVATEMFLSDSIGLAADARGQVIVCARFAQRVCRLDVEKGTLTVIAGDGWCDGGGDGRYAGDNGPAITASFWSPVDAAFDPLGNLYIVEWGNHCVRKIDATTNIITTIAGTGEPAG